MKSYVTGSKFRAMLTDKNIGTSSTIPYFIVTVNIELTRSISKTLYKDNNTVPSGVFEFNCFAINLTLTLLTWRIG